MIIDRATEVFVRGFAFTRSFTYPYLAEQLAPGLWVLRDAPRLRGDYRGEEYVATGISADAIDALARRHTRGRFRVCVSRAADDLGAPIRAAFRALGYRLRATEAFMLHPLAVARPGGRTLSDRCVSQPRRRLNCWRR